MIPDRLPPQNLEAEQGVLGAILLDNTVLVDVLSVLRAEHFYRDSHQVLYRAIVDLYGRGAPVDSIALEESLRRSGELEKAGGLDAILQLLGAVPHSANARYYAQVVFEKSVARDLALAGAMMERDAYSGLYTAEQLQANADRYVSAVSMAMPSDSARPIADVMAGVAERYDARKGMASIGIPSGLDDLDAIIIGWQKGDLIIVAARPSVGKTAISQQFAVRAAERSGVPVYFRSIEMGAGAIGDRLAGAAAGVDGWKLRTASLGPPEMDGFRAACRRLAGLPIVIDDAGGQPVEQIVAGARRMKARQGLGLVVVDYLQLIPGSGGRGEANRQQEIAHVSQRLKGLARDLDVPVIALSQLNRAVENRDDGRPRLSDLRESGAIEQDADVVLLMSRHDVGEPSDKTAIVELNVAKQRNGGVGVVKLVFAKDRGVFSSLAREPIAPAIPDESLPFKDAPDAEDWTARP